jgi:hypothetical protein
MSQAKKSTTPTLFLLILLLILVFLFSVSACSPTQRGEFIKLGQTVSNQVDQSLEEPNEVVFAGQVEDENGRWLNNYVIVLFKNGVEIARTISRLQESALTASGPMDGVFVLRIPNEYELDISNNFYYTNGTAIIMQAVTGVVGTAYIGTWFDRQPAGNPVSRLLLHRSSSSNRLRPPLIRILFCTGQTLPLRTRVLQSKIEAAFTR